ncbi:putative ABC transporter ATP-binding protein YlmA [Anaerohalosphaera lusitana]|uniref:Putative ABC transporter ATP-binding protein YlmA n=1 Tax=Anaerohalosphaera lusitana TaxID=1936003 RepID=A0A1U9NH90_9BACT|nr:ATP-binding cassette domain-containing protein [Anaerohalosphaera lusitana]AQT67301.1 putative ABC transporter ATP-binding protein YlmA [Anaerohalosphaera lusitana]
MALPIIDIDSVTFRRKDSVILSDVSWRIEPGRNWALLGGNGAGKTTLLNIVLGYAWPTTGSVTVFGEKFGDCAIRELRKSVGYVSSSMGDRVPTLDTPLEIAMSGIDASFGLYRQFTEAETVRGRRTLEAVNVAHLAERKFATLSQGERQRVLISRALVNEPKLLVLDEPCVGLDPAARHDFLCDLGEMAGRDDAPAIIFVTHHIEEIHPWLDSVFMLKDGSCLASGSSEKHINSDTLGELFNCDCEVTRTGHGWSLNINGKTNDR